MELMNVSLQSAHATHWVRSLDSHVRFAIAVGVGVLTGLLLPHSLLLQTRLVIGYDAGAFCLLALAWLVMTYATPHSIHANALRQDLSRTVIFGLVLFCALGSMGANLFTLASTKGDDISHAAKLGHASASVVAVLCSWFLTHTTFAIHYARRYYQDVARRSHVEAAGGLKFPNEGQPDYWDFAYYSFVIGMCFQVSDVSAVSRPMRRLTLAHSILSFFFNTAVLALAVNVATSVL